MCSEGMATLIKMQKGMVRGVKVIWWVPTICHVFFWANGNLFFRANEIETHILKGILDRYANTYGQMIKK